MDYKQIRFNSDKYRIEFLFPFSVGLKNRVKALPDAHFDGEERLWWIPPTEYGAKLCIKFGKEHGFLIDKPVMDMGKDPVFTRSDLIRNKMYPFQVKGLDFLHTTSGRAIIADEMGLGKTVSALGYIQERGFHKNLIVAPASVTYKWQQEIDTWLHKTSSIITKGADPLPESDFTIMSYAIFTHKIEQIRRHGYQLALFDESHYLANRESQRTRAAKSLMVPYFLGLSGTPFLNRPIELYPQLNILNPARWNSYWKYAMEFCGAHQGKFGWDVSGATNLNKLKKELEPYFLRRTKQEVMSELPDLTRVNIPIDYDKSFGRDYNQALDDARKMAKELGGKSHLAIIAGLRQIIGLMKVAPAVELAEGVLSSKDKVVLFAHHKSVVSALEDRLNSYGVIKIVGDTSQSDRLDNVNKFLHDPKYRVAIISQAGGEGIDLYSADTLIFVEREWNPGKEGQIEARLHRIGQKSNVEIIYLIVRNTLDERIHRVIENKREVFGQIISLDDIPVLDLLEV